MALEDPNVSCCFCGHSVLFKEAVQISFCPTSNIEQVQVLYAHPGCLDKTLHASVPRLFDNLTNGK